MRLGLSRLRLVALTVLSSVALTACGHSPAKDAKVPPVPISAATATRLAIERECPPEATAELPARVTMPAEAVLKGNEAGLEYAGGRFRREEALQDRAEAVAAACAEIAGGGRR